MYRWHLMKNWRRFLFLVLAGSVAAISLASGCSKNTPKISTDPSKANLVGKITYQGKPFPGFILVQSEDNRHTAKATIARDGSYVVGGAPIGKAKIGLLPSPHRRPRQTREGQNSEIKQPNMIPAQYNDPSKSGLTVEIHSGRNEYSVDLP